MENVGRIEHARKPEKLPTVMTKAEVRQVLASMSGKYLLMAQLLYGCALRLIECVRLRGKDIDFGQNQVIVREAIPKGVTHTPVTANR